LKKETYYTKTTKIISEETDYEIWEVKLIIKHFFKGMEELIKKGFEIDIYRIFKIIKKK
jgi:hypothetical protein